MVSARVTPQLDKITGEVYRASGRDGSRTFQRRRTNTFLRVVFLPFVFMHKMNNLSVFSGADSLSKVVRLRQDRRRVRAAWSATIRYFHVGGPQFVAYTEGTVQGGEKVDMNILT